MNFVDSKSLSTFVFQSPFTALIAGPTQAGKTTFLKKVLNSNSEYIFPQTTKIIYCYARWQDVYDQLLLTVEPKIEFIKGLPDIDEINSNENNLIILDDLMSDCEKDKSILNLFTTDSHQKNISVFLITQNLFSQGKFSRTISLNCHYLIIMNNPRDRSQIFYLSRQMYPNNSKFLIECYSDAVENKQFGYLFIDLKQTTDKNFRVQTGILNGEERIIYQLRND